MTITYIRIPIELFKLPYGRTELAILALALSFGNDGLGLSNNQMAEILSVNRRNVIRTINKLRTSRLLLDKGTGKQNRRLHGSSKLLAMVVAQTSPPETGGSGADATSGSGANVTKVVAQTTPITKRTEYELKSEVNADAVRLADLLFSEIQKRKPDYKKPNLKTWARDVDRMIRLDKRKPERIEAVIRWCQADAGDGEKAFGWQNNILSTGKLREKFDKLELDMQKRPGRQAVAPPQRGPDGLTARERALKG